MQNINSNQYEALLFDIDGVIFDSELYHRYAWIETMIKFDLQLTHEELVEWTGVPDAKMAAHFAARTNSPADSKLFLETKQELFTRFVDTDLESFEGLQERLVMASDRYKLGFATSNNRTIVTKMLKKSDLHKLFLDGATFDDVQNHKPAPEVFQNAAAKLQVEPSRAIAFEDSSAGIASAQGAGCYTIGITSTLDADALQPADAVFPTTVKALDWLLGNR